MTLNDVSNGDPFVISAILAQGEIRRRLVDMGFVEGANGVVMRRFPWGGPLELRLGATRIALREAEARSVQVSAKS